MPLEGRTARHFVANARTRGLVGWTVRSAISGRLESLRNAGHESDRDHNVRSRLIGAVERGERRPPRQFRRLSLAVLRLTAKAAYGTRRAVHLSRPAEGWSYTAC